MRHHNDFTQIIMFIIALVVIYEVMTFSKQKLNLPETLSDGRNITPELFRGQYQNDSKNLETNKDL